MRNVCYEAWHPLIVKAWHKIDPFIYILNLFINNFKNKHMYVVKDLQCNDHVASCLVLIEMAVMD